MSYFTSSKTMTPGTYAEPEIYYAEYPAIEQQRRYAFQGALACLFVTSLILVALAVSY